MTTRAPAITATPSPIRTGSSVTVRTQGKAQTRLESCSSIRTSGAIAGAASPPTRSDASARVPLIASRTSRSFNGGSSTTRSLSAIAPLLPNVITGPNTASVCTPIATSWAPSILRSLRTMTPAWVSWRRRARRTPSCSSPYARVSIRPSRKRVRASGSGDFAGIPGASSLSVTG